MHNAHLNAGGCGISQGERWYGAVTCSSSCEAWHGLGPCHHLHLFDSMSCALHQVIKQVRNYNSRQNAACSKEGLSMILSQFFKVQINDGSL